MDRAFQRQCAHPYCNADEPVAADPAQEYLVPLWGACLPTKTKIGRWQYTRLAIFPRQSDR